MIYCMCTGKIIRLLAVLAADISNTVVSGTLHGLSIVEFKD